MITQHVIITNTTTYYKSEYGMGSFEIGQKLII